VPFTAAPLADGGVQVEWRGPGGTVEVEISPEGAFGYLLLRGAGAAEEATEGGGASLPGIMTIITSVVVPSGRA
jgi:hypothetical protein